jgi:hypothetical protein
LLKDHCAKDILKNGSASGVDFLGFWQEKIKARIISEIKDLIV